MVAVRLESVSVVRGGATILHDIDLRVDHAEVVAVLGETGSGKTTLLRVIAGLDPVTTGTVAFDDHDMAGVSAQHRNVAVVFQAPALFPNRTVGGNISFPLEIRRATVQEITDRVGAEARALHIGDLLDADPAILSDGHQRIVEIARALVKQPDVMLLDEPFRGVDEHRVAVLRREVGLIQRAFEVTTLVVVHDAHEAQAIADRVVVLDRGTVAQVGRFDEVHRRPRTGRIAQLTGDAAVLPGIVVAGRDGDAFVDLGGPRLHTWRPAVRDRAGHPVEVVVRPEWWRIDPNGPIEATVEQLPIPGYRHLIVSLAGRRVDVALAPDQTGDLTAGDVVRLAADEFHLC